MRLKCPGISIYISKLDLDTAYHRLHLLAVMAVMTIIIIKKIAHILLHLPFGVANGPNNFYLISKPIIDFTNDILWGKTWSPQATHSSLKPRFKLPSRSSNKAIQHAHPLFVDVPFHPEIVDGYIDDIITVMLDQTN